MADKFYDGVKAIHKARKNLAKTFQSLAQKCTSKEQFAKSVSDAFSDDLKDSGEINQLTNKAQKAYIEAEKTKDSKIKGLSIFGKLVDWVLDKIGSKKSINAEFIDDLSKGL